MYPDPWSRPQASLLRLTGEEIGETPDEIDLPVSGFLFENDLQTPNEIILIDTIYRHLFADTKFNPLRNHMGHQMLLCISPLSHLCGVLTQVSLKSFLCVRKTLKVQDVEVQKD